MILPIHQEVRRRVKEALSGTFGLAEADQPEIVINMPPTRALGDLALPVAFELARKLRKAPKVIGQELAAALGTIPGVARVEAANGYVNLFLTRDALLREWLGTALKPGSVTPAGAETGKVIVEHTAINPNKAAHIGHVRNSALGDTLVRLLRFQGREVEVQNYIDDTGVQVADVVVGFTSLEHRDLAGVKAVADDPATRFDYYCWDLYARVTEWYEADKARLQVRAHALHEIETGGNALAEMGAFIADRIVRAHIKTMARLGVSYDLLTWEGDILRLHFWATAFESLKTRGAVHLQTEGRLAGCWVMPIESESAADAAEAEGAEAASDAAAGKDEDEDDAEGREKVIVRSNGTVTYVGKDIANQFWKFGLLGKDFHYRPFDSAGGHTLWATTSENGHGAGAPAFGRAAAVYNVIDSRQAYLQQLLKQALDTMGFRREAAHSTHVSYEMVALSHATARALGYADTAADGKPFVEVSGRKGLGVKADDLIDQLIATARGEVRTRHADLSDRDCDRIAESIATAALRYFLVKFSRGRIIAFDIDEALSFEGETGPYLQYAVVRASNILTKLRERDGVDEPGLTSALQSAGTDALAAGEEGDELWGLVLEAARLDEMVDVAVRTLEPASLAKFTFGVAQRFNAFYHRQPIMQEERADTRLWRAAAVAYTRRSLVTALTLMGCQVPERM
jgi:arginyl-tRNA synthetase